MSKITIRIPRNILIIKSGGRKMETIICLLILCFTCIIIVWLFSKDKIHDLVIKIGNYFYVGITKHKKE